MCRIKFGNPLVALGLFSLPFAMFAQADLTMTSAHDGNFQVGYASNLNLGDGVINVTNTGASAGTDVPLVGQNSYGDICVNLYVYAPGGFTVMIGPHIFPEQLATCCVCKVTPNAIRSWPIYFGPYSLLAYLTAQNPRNALRGSLDGNISLVVMLYATVARGITGTNPQSSYCINPGIADSPSVGRATTGMVAWVTHSHPTNTSSVAITETPFINSTLSSGEYQNLTTDCSNHQGGSSSNLCPGCQRGGLDAPVPTLQK